MVDCSDLMGKPYEPNGRGPESYDCYGLVLEVERRFGVALPDYRGDAGMLGDESSRLIESGRARRIGEPVPGAMLLFHSPRGQATHIGVYLGDNNFIHASIHGGVKIERLSARTQTLMGAYIWRS